MTNIAYIRVSHVESLNGTSLEVQEKRCRAFAELHNFSIDKVYQECVSGSVEFRKRPVFQKVLSELKSGSKLVVSRLDRLSRKVVDTLKLIEDFKKERKEICITDIGNIHKDGVTPHIPIKFRQHRAGDDRLVKRHQARHIIGFQSVTAIGNILDVLLPHKVVPVELPRVRYKEFVTACIDEELRKVQLFDKGVRLHNLDQAAVLSGAQPVHDPFVHIGVQRW